jgi:hypothetical protein
MRRLPISIAAAALASSVLACGSPPPETTVPEELDIVYRVERSRPPAKLELHVPPRGTAKLYATRPVGADPTGAAGYFAVRPTSDERGALEQQIDAHRLLDRHDEADLSERSTGRLALHRGKRSTELSLDPRDEGLRGLALLLDGLATRAAGRPLAALALDAHARADRGTARFEIAFVHRGIRALDATILPDRDPSGALGLRLMLERGGKLVNELQASPDDLGRLFHEKKHRLEPNTRWRLPPLAMPLPSNEAGLFVRVEAKLRIETAHERAMDVELTSPSVSLGDEEEP